MNNRCAAEEKFCGAPVALYISLDLDLAVYPCENIGINLVFVELVEHLVPAVLVELNGNVLHTDFFEIVIGKFNALAALANGVHIAGHEVNGGILVHILKIILIGDELYTCHHIPEQTAAWDKTAEGIGHILIDLSLIAAEPVVFSPDLAVELVVAAEGHVVEKLAVMMGPLESDDKIAHSQSSEYEGRALIAGAAYDGRVECAGKTDKVSPCNKASHAVSENYLRNVGIVLLHSTAKYLLIVYYVCPAVLIRQESELIFFLNALTVAKVIGTDGYEAV